MSLLDTRQPWTLAAILIGIYVVGVVPSLGQSLLESHAFRQTQTAYTAVLYAERGIDLLRPPLPVLGPPGIIPLEFPLFQAGGAVLMDLGLAPDLAMRVLGLACFVGTAVVVFVLARRIMGALGALVALAALLFNPLAWSYGRSSLIEYLAAGAGIAFLLFALRWAETGRRMELGAAFAAACVAVLVKVTTGGFYLLPALALRSRDGRWGFQSPIVWAVVLAAAAVGFGWSVYAEGVRAGTPAAAFLAVENQHGWLFGTLAQRLDVGEWRVPTVAMLMLTGSGLALWAPTAVLQARRLRQGPFAAALIAIAVAAPLVLFNLYAVHDYYFAAVAPLVALGIGMGAEWLSAHRGTRWARRAMVGLAGAWLATIIGLFGSWSIIYGTPPEESRALRIAGYIRDHSDPDDWVILRGMGWNPTFLYYARRQGIAVPDHAGLQDTATIDIETILSDPRLGPEISCDAAGLCSVTDR